MVVPLYCRMRIYGTIESRCLFRGGNFYDVSVGSESLVVVDHGCVYTVLVFVGMAGGTIAYLGLSSSVVTRWMLGVAVAGRSDVGISTGVRYAREGTG